jgi:1-acyl-sn-glycerol-3-phosphate acyltransferase
MGCLYSVFRPIVRCLCKTYGRMEIYGLENFPKEGGVVLASNHASYLDPIILGGASPRPLYYMARDSLFKGPLLKKFLLSCNAFPMNRDSVDLGSIRKALQLLSGGKVVTIFPEGTRSHDGKIHKGKEGVAMLGIRSSSKILPTKIVGSDKCMPRGSKFVKPGKLIVKFGNFIDCSVYSKKKDRKLYSELSEQVIETIKKL